MRMITKYDYAIVIYVFDESLLPFFYEGQIAPFFDEWHPSLSSFWSLPLIVMVSSRSYSIESGSYKNQTLCSRRSYI